MGFPAALGLAADGAGTRRSGRPAAVGRFLLFALPLTVLLIAVFNLVLELMGLAPDLGPLVGWHVAAWGCPAATC